MHNSDRRNEQAKYKSSKPPIYPCKDSLINKQDSSLTNVKSLEQPLPNTHLITGKETKKREVKVGGP